jgi:hypothetical protein
VAAVSRGTEGTSYSTVTVTTAGDGLVKRGGPSFGVGMNVVRKIRTNTIIVSPSE